MRFINFLALIPISTLVSGCTSLYGVSMQGIDQRDAENALRPFLEGKGFRPETCTWNFNKSTTVVVSCWQKNYSGSLGGNGSVSVAETIDEGVFAVYIQSNRQESEASDLKDDLVKSLARSYPNVKIKLHVTSQMDLR